jgi:hypothetical protein
MIEAIKRGAMLAAWSPPPHPGTERGYARLYQEQITQAEDGCDFAFLRKGGTRKGGTGRVIAE